jgi:hypothetical protein
MADNDDGAPNAGGVYRERRKISKRAMRRLDDDVIDKILLQPDRERHEPSWWRVLLKWLTRKLDRGPSDRC